MCANGCGRSVYQLEIQHQTFQFEDIEGKIPHTKLRCEIYQIVSTTIQGLQIEINIVKPVGDLDWRNGIGIVQSATKLLSY